MATLRVEFDRGTLRLEGDVDRASRGGRAVHMRFDARVGIHRAPAYQYARVPRPSSELEVDDRVRAGMLPYDGAIEVGPLRPYQEQAVDTFESLDRRGIVVLPTGAGKTRVALAAIARARVSALILVPTRALLEQWAALLRAAQRGPVGTMGDGIVEIEPLTVSTFESAYRRLDTYGDRFGMLVVDEVHHFASGVRAEALETCAAPFRLGLTATMARPASEGERRLRELLGPVVCELGIADLAGTHLAALDTIRLAVALEEGERARYEHDIEPFRILRHELLQRNPYLEWSECLRAISRTTRGPEIVSAMHRATALATYPAAKRRCVRELLARHRRDRTLVFTASARDAYAIGTESLVPVITGETSREERERILTRFRDGTVRTIASARVLNEGIDVPEANVAIVVGGALGAREHVQRIGRILRPREGKRATAYELVTLDTIDEARTRARGRALAADRAAVTRHA